MKTTTLEPGLKNYTILFLTRSGKQDEVIVDAKTEENAKRRFAARYEGEILKVSPSN